MAASVNHFITVLSIIGDNALEVSYYISYFFHFNCSKGKLYVTVMSNGVVIYVEGNRNSKIFSNRYRRALSETKLDVSRSSHRRCSVTKGVLRNLLKKRLWHRCFPVNFAKFLRTPFSQNTSGRLLLCLLKSMTEFSNREFFCGRSLRNCFEFSEKVRVYQSCGKTI